VPLHLQLGSVNTLRDLIVSTCKKANKLTPGGEEVDVDREIDRLEDEIEEAEEQAKGAKARCAQIQKFLPKAGFDPTALMQMGAAARDCTKLTLLGALIEKQFGSETFEGEVVRCEGEERGDEGGWHVVYEDGASEGLNYAQIERLVQTQTLLGRKIKKNFEDAEYMGEVVEYDRSGQTKLSPWLVLFDDGDMEHLSRDQLKLQLQGSDSGGLRECDAAKQLL
jgi:hypothetical protein